MTNILKYDKVRRCPKCLDSFLWIDGISTPYTYACSCGWGGYDEDLIIYEEYKNIRRTELIDKVLK
jgi:hypothetical protein